VLTSCDLRQNRIGVEGAKALASALEVNRVLTSCSLAVNRIGDEGAKALASALEVNRVLTECNVRGNNLDTESATALAKVATKKRVMLFGIKHDQTEADLHGQNLKPVDAILIASDLQVSRVLTKLDLSQNWVGPQLGIVMAGALKVNAVLTEVNLGANSIGPLGATAIAEALMKVNRVLTSLDLSVNELCGIHFYSGRGTYTAVGITTIAEALKVNRVLTSLDVGFNQLTEEAALSIVRVEQQRNKLTSLGLLSCNIGTIGAKEIAEWISVSRVLTKLDLRHNSRLNETSKQLLRSAVHSRGNFELLL